MPIQRDRLSQVRFCFLQTAQTNKSLGPIAIEGRCTWLPRDGFGIRGQRLVNFAACLQLVGQGQTRPGRALQVLLSLTG